ncbi:MAG TPA: TonB family protein [Candidatus Cloacimonadota bacterium]|nr:TonB family protein [Candidatus Cloacimonadota bacterium]
MLKYSDWKDVANSQLAKAVTLALVLTTFVLVVTPNVEARKQKFTITETELVDIPMEEREKLEQPEVEVKIDVPIIISDELSTTTDPTVTAKYEQALAQIGDISITTSTALSRERDGEMVVFEAYDDPPVIIGELRPEYPAAARRTRTQGTVWLEVEVYRDGSVGNIRVQKSVIGLDDAAIAAVRKAKFQPGKSGGHPIDTLVIIDVEFRLN